MTELLRVPHTMNLSWRYGTSWYFAEFIRALRDERRLLGLRCPECRHTYLPPRPVCGNCHVALREWVEVQDIGTVVAFTTVHLPILDPATGEPRPTPYGMALIQLDGANTTLNHFLAENDLTKLRIGIRVRAVWRAAPLRAGTLRDIVHFVEINDEQ
ncbi:MAG: Zn-ribbon domain-containing OB-fold protein [Anaerolineales bacterium]